VEVIPADGRDASWAQLRNCSRDPWPKKRQRAVTLCPQGTLKTVTRL
jgi:hypothetical protein